MAVRYDATPDAANYVDKNYSPTGQIQFPVITLHTDQDPLLPLFHEEICAQTVGGRAVQLRPQLVIISMDCRGAFYGFGSSLKPGERL